MMKTIILWFWSLLFDSTIQNYFGIISFSIDEFLHSKVVSYQFGYAVHNEAGDCIIVMYFYTTMINNKKQ